MIQRCGICARPTLPSFEFGVRICVAHGPLTWDAFRYHLERDLDADAEGYRSGIAAKARDIQRDIAQQAQALSTYITVNHGRAMSGAPLLTFEQVADVRQFVMKALAERAARHA